MKDNELRIVPAGEGQQSVDALTEKLIENEKESELKRTALQFAVTQGPGLIWASPEQQIEMMQRSFDAAKRFLTVAKNLS
jgi:hypothetical protein